MKYPERMTNTSKNTDMSIMHCPTVSEVLLPPYAVYKSENLWESWGNGHSKGARYNHTNAARFDAHFCKD